MEFKRIGQRYRKILAASLSAVFSKGTNILVNAITVPITVRYLGAESYGLWITISGAISLFVLLDIGIANTLTNLISEAYASDDKSAATEYFSNAFWMISLVAASIGLVAWLVWPSVNWAHLLNVQNRALFQSTSRAIGVAFAILLFSLPVGLAPRVLGGYQELHKANLFASAGSVGSLVGVLTVVLLRGSLPWLIAGYAGPIVAANLACLLWISLYHKPWIKPLLGMVKGKQVRRIFQSGMQFFVIQVAGLIVFNSDNLVISHFLSPSQVTPYNITWRFVNYFMGIQTMIVPAMWPAFSEAYARGDIDWVRSAYWRIRMITLGCLTAGWVVLVPFGRPLIRLWAGPAAVPTMTLLCLMCLWMSICAITINQSTLMGATSRVKKQAISSSIAAIVNLCLSIVWVKTMGVVGVLLATVVSYIVFVLAVQVMEVRRILRGDFLTPTSSVSTHA